MASMNEAARSERGGQFLTTHWTAVLNAKGSSAEAQGALENLCQTYWYPLYAFLRCKGQSPHDAQDLVQGFFAQLLGHNHLGKVDRQKGKFRSFLLASLEHYLSDQRDHANALKRGGGQKIVSLDEQVAEERYRLEPADPLSPDTLFERRWALTVLEEARVRLRAEFIEAGKRDLHDQLRAVESADPFGPSQAEAAQRLAMTEAAFKSANFRFRQRFRELIREEIGRTVATSSEIDDEIRHLISIVS